MFFTEEQLKRLNICNSIVCKINRGNILEEELGEFIFNIRNRINSKLPNDEVKLSNERYIQAFEVESLWRIRNKIFGISGIDDIFTNFSIRLCIGDSLVNDVTRIKELSVLSDICDIMALIPTDLQSVAENLLDSNNKKPLYDTGTTIKR
ncbi:MAG: hypothetical protein IJE89_05325 [Bacilli bacterium]|nr:hypothetical protein [Bacilli bacterium]